MFQFLLGYMVARSEGSRNGASIGAIATVTFAVLLALSAVGYLMVSMFRRPETESCDPGPIGAGMCHLGGSALSFGLCIGVLAVFVGVAAWVLNRDSRG